MITLFFFLIKNKVETQWKINLSLSEDIEISGGEKESRSF